MFKLYLLPIVPEFIHLPEPVLRVVSGRDLHIQLGVVHQLHIPLCGLYGQVLLPNLHPRLLLLPELLRSEVSR